MDILIPSFILGALGLIFGIGLAVASKKLNVRVDPRLEEIHGLLPGANCGTCGGAGCFAFAEDLLSGKENINACRVCRGQKREKIIEILNRK